MEGLLLKLNLSHSQHIMHDFAPYICLYPDCPTPHSRYSSSQEWLLHMEEIHIPRQWVCDSHPELTFPTENLFCEHIMSGHDPTISTKHLAALAQVSTRPVTPVFLLCPLCAEIPHKIVEKIESSAIEPNSPLFYRTLNQHIKKHLQTLALTSLDWLSNGTASKGGDDEESFDPRMHAETREMILLLDEEPPGFELDPDWNGNPPIAPDIDDDVAFLQWTTKNPEKTPKRDNEWLLSRKDRILPLYIDPLNDVTLSNFRVKYAMLSSEERQSQILVPHSDGTLEDPANVLNLIRKNTSNDEADRNVRVKMRETREVQSYLESIESTIHPSLVTPEFLKSEDENLRVETKKRTIADPFPPEQEAEPPISSHLGEAEAVSSPPERRKPIP